MVFLADGRGGHRAGNIGEGAVTDPGARLFEIETVNQAITASRIAVNRRFHLAGQDTSKRNGNDTQPGFSDAIGAHAGDLIGPPSGRIPAVDQ